MVKTITEQTQINMGYLLRWLVSVEACWTHILEVSGVVRRVDVGSRRYRAWGSFLLVYGGKVRTHARRASLSQCVFFCFEFSLPVNNLLLLAKCGALLHWRSYWSDSARDPNKQDIQYDPPTYISLPSKRESRMWFMRSVAWPGQHRAYCKICLQTFCCSRICYL